MLRNWSIDLGSRHCAHPSGLQAYFDLGPTRSGALRVVGPFGAEGLLAPAVKAWMQDLSAALEALPQFHACYVLWGAYASKPQGTEFQLDVLGSPAGFLPNPCLRTELALCVQNATLNTEREWQLDKALGIARHNNGLIFEIAPPSSSRGLSRWLPGCQRIRISADSAGGDPATMHPSLAPDMLALLGEWAWQLLQGRAPDPVRDKFQFQSQNYLFHWQQGSQQIL